MGHQRLPFLLPSTLALAAFSLIGCSESEPESNSEGDVTWSGEMRSLVEENCTVCHYTGGSTPFAFESYEEVSNASAAMMAAIDDRRMPPWPADPDCRSYENQMGLSDEEMALFRDWVDAGTPEGQPTEPIELEIATFEATDFATAKDAYTPNLGAAGDDYRCFLLDLEFDEPTFVTGASVSPDTESVHHVLVYSLTPAEVEQAEALDGAEEGEGYTCFGGPLSGEEGGGLGGGGLPNQIASWVPGSEPSNFEDAAVEITTGSRIVMQMHYSAVGGAPEPDHTELQLRLTTDEPEFVLRTVPLAIRDLDIPAGEADVTFSSMFKNWSDKPATIRSLAGHMHLLGQSIDAQQVAAAGGETTCGVSIPEWDFDWQMSYALGSEDALVLQPGEGIDLTCVYDNTAENQPFVDGVQQEPRDVEWGDGSLDEMCLMYASVVEPYDGPDAGGAGCEPAADCFAASDGSLTALMECEETSWDCAACALQNGAQCGLGACLLPLASASSCLTNCVVSVNAFGGSLDSCLSEVCGDTYEQLLSCADPVLESGSCDEALGSCGLVAP